MTCGGALKSLFKLVDKRHHIMIILVSIETLLQKKKLYYIHSISYITHDDDPCFNGDFTANNNITYDNTSFR